MLSFRMKVKAVGIILLFLGVAIAPSINQSVVTASQDDDLIEVTTQAYGIEGYKDTALKLTKVQYQNLEEYLVGFRARLNQTTTKEEAVPIFKEAVVELDKYGLLPRGLHVKSAQRLVSGLNYNTSIETRLKQINQMVMEENENRFCLIYGSTTHTRFFGLVAIFHAILFRIYYELRDWFYAKGYINLSYFFDGLAMILLLWVSFVFPHFNEFKPTSLYTPQVQIGLPSLDPYYGDAPASGWVITNGLNGKISWNGLLFGDLGGLTGIKGFTGLKLSVLKGNDYYHNDYFGFAIRVKISNAV